MEQDCWLVTGQLGSWHFSGSIAASRFGGGGEGSAMRLWQGAVPPFLPEQEKLPGENTKVFEREKWPNGKEGQHCCRTNAWAQRCEEGIAGRASETVCTARDTVALWGPSCLSGAAGLSGLSPRGRPYLRWPAKLHGGSMSRPCTRAHGWSTRQCRAQSHPGNELCESVGWYRASTFIRSLHRRGANLCSHWERGSSPSHPFVPALLPPSKAFPHYFPCTRTPTFSSCLPLPLHPPGFTEHLLSTNQGVVFPGEVDSLISTPVENHETTAVEEKMAMAEHEDCIQNNEPYKVAVSFYSVIINREGDL